MMMMIWQVNIHTDTLNESGFVEHTIAAFKGRTIHAYHRYKLHPAPFFIFYYNIRNQTLPHPSVSWT